MGSCCIVISELQMVNKIIAASKSGHLMKITPINQ